MFSDRRRERRESPGAPDVLSQDSGSEIRISTRRLSRFESELSLARSGFQGPNPMTTTSEALTPG